jgi:signal transduction histidine kinase
MVEERTRELRAGEEELKRSYAAAAVGRMGATIAHDLRTPLNVISQAAEGLDKFPESRERLVEMIRSNAGRALTMIEDIRNTTRDIEVRAVRTNLASMVRNAVADANTPPEIEAKTEIGDGLETVVIDPNLVRRSRRNRSRNAVEAGAEGGMLTTSACREETSSRYVSPTRGGDKR